MFAGVNGIVAEQGSEATPRDGDSRQIELIITGKRMLALVLGDEGGKTTRVVWGDLPLYATMESQSPNSSPLLTSETIHRLISNTATKCITAYYQHTGRL